MQGKPLHIILFIVCLQAASIPLFSQDQALDSALYLNEVVIHAPRVTRFSAGLKKNRFHSLAKMPFQHKNLSDLLAGVSPVFVKSYGLGSLATSSFRGGSAYHTAVLWNGFSLSSPMNGLMDLSLIPLAATDEIELHYGGSSALFGSGAVAGTIHLHNAPQFNRGISAGASLSAGSFSDFRQNAVVQVSQERWVSTIKLFNATARNDFKYKNKYAPDETAVRQSNAQIANRGLISENRFLINDYQLLSINAWLQHTSRNMPPTLLQIKSRSHQQDDAFRFSAEWRHERRNTESFIRAAWFSEKVVFSDELSRLNETSLTRQFIAEAETKISISPAHFINIGLHNTLAAAKHPSFSMNPQQHRLALFASYRYQSRNEKLHAGISVRQEMADQKLLPFTWSADGRYDLTPWLALRVNLARVYRIPTFNDMFWVPGGNPDLLPEDGYTAETGVRASLGEENSLVQFKSDVTVFTRNIRNWILWMPGNFYWRPLNVMQVWSRGLETHHSLGLRVGKLRIELDVLTNYLPSTSEAAVSANDKSLHKQLIYSPMYSGMAGFSVRYNQLLLSYRQNYVGYRFTSTDNTQYLKPYDLGTVYLSYLLTFSDFKASFFANIDNVWNRDYQAIVNRAMPGIHFNAGMNIHFNRKINNHQ